MKDTVNKKQPEAAFTLVELLTVIAIMGIVAGLVVGLVGVAGKAKRKARVTGELNALVTAIDSFHAEFNTYPTHNYNHVPPPDGPPTAANPRLNTLFLELKGTTYNGVAGSFGTRDGRVSMNAEALTNLFGGRVDGLINAGDSGPGKDFLPSISPSQTALIKIGDPPVYTAVILTVPAEGPLTNGVPDMIPGWDAGVGGSPPPLYAQDIEGNAKTVNPWRFNPVNPQNNPSTYDLWAEIRVGDEKLIIGNWDN